MKILVIRIGAIGDFVNTLPVFSALRKKFPKAHIEIMGYPATAVLAKSTFYANAISDFGQRDVACFFRKHECDTSDELPPQLVKYFASFDIIITFLNLKEKTFVKNLSKIKGPKIIYHDTFPQESEKIHITDHLLKSLTPLGVADYGFTPEIFVNADGVDYANKFFTKHNLNNGKTVAAIHPGSGSKKKCWAVDRFAAVAQWLREELSASILIVSGPADEDNVNKLMKMSYKLKPVLIGAGLPLLKLAAVLKNCDLFIGNDSGVTHIAAAVQTPTIAIFGPTDADIWSPRGGEVKVVKKNVTCSPCPGQQRNQCEHQICLEEIVVDDIMFEIRNILS